MKYRKKILINLICSIVMFCVFSTGTSYANEEVKFSKDPYVNESNFYFSSNNIKINDKKSRYIYDSIYNALINFKDSINLSKYGAPNSKEVFDILKVVLNDYPEIFYFEHKGSLYYSDGMLYIKYKYPKDKAISMKKEIDKVVGKIISENIDESMSNFDKVMAIHDYMVLNTSYDWDAFQNSYNSNTELSYGPYGTLVKHTGVCSGYSRSMKVLLNKIGIDCRCVSSDGMNHAWNMVKIDGEWYHMDCTWDDPVPDRKGIVGYEYFALSDKDISTGKKPHTGWDKNVFPKCSNDKYRVFKDMESTIKTKNYIYYRSISKNRGYIYRINKNNLSIEPINKMGYPFKIEGGYLYYKDSIKSTKVDKVYVGDFSYFNDINNHWAKKEIEDFYKSGYISGDGNSNKFRPNDPITRAEFVKIFNKYFGLTKSSGKVFNDTKNHWAKKEVDIAFTNGVTKGISKDLFAPDKPIKRQEVAKMIANYKKISDNKIDKINTFSDFNNIAPWAVKEVEGIVEAGYMKGDKDGNKFRPTDNITRAETVATLSRVK